MEIKFRLLNAEEIEVRIATCNKAGVQLLLYKTARSDVSILDETVGPLNWSKRYTRDNKNCIISLWDDTKHLWVEKEDTGTESFTEAAKGLASDSQKRAGFVVGIGRELYTAPPIFMYANTLKTFRFEGNKYKCSDSFRVAKIVYNSDRTINTVIIQNTTTNRYFEFRNPDYSYETVILQDNPPHRDAPVPSAKQENISKKQQQELLNKCHTSSINVALLFDLYKVDSIEQLTKRKYENILEHWDEIIYKCGELF